MKIVFVIILFSNLLFSSGGVIVFNDGTTLEGDITNVNKSSIFITPIGLTFSEEIRMENVDSLKLYDGKLLVANNKALILYADGKFFDPGLSQDNIYDEDEDYEVEYVLVPNWSLNLYTGYPIIRSESLSDRFYDDINPVVGFSIGSPYGFFFENFYVNGIVELAYYNFSKKVGEASDQFDGFAYQIGISPGFFIGQASINLTACTGIYHAGTGFIGGGGLDIPLGSIFEDNEFFEAVEFRITSRANIVQKEEGGSTYWLDGGISIGYEF
ncbi:MAG: hypothetical protein VXA26_02050 [Candidatus Neomarinimicrobiota bacterium]